MGPVGTSKTWTPGLQVGRHLLLRELARGGMAEIWLAQQPGPQGFSREVVIKRIITSGAEQPADFEKLFFDEARLASQLSHPNIVQLFAFDEADDGTPYLVMEYLAGESLAKVQRELITLGQPMAASRAVAIIERCAQGLGYAHRKRGPTGEPLEIVHRDVSPQNVFVTYDGVVKVLDFGIARAAGRSTKTATGLVRGKVTYMAPEQADGKAFAASDVFSLGVILFELLTGARFYGDLEQLAVFKRLLADEQPFAGPRAVNPSVPESLDVLVRKMLERDPARRFTDGLELASALSEWQRSTGTGAGEAELRELMHGLFSGRIRDTHDFLASVRAGLIPEVSTPSGPGTMPGVTQSLVKPRPPPAPPAPPQTRAPEPPTKSPRLVPRLALGGLLLTALIGAALAGRSSSSRSEAAPSPPAPAAAATVLMGVDAGPPTLTDATPVLDAGLTPHVDEPGPPPASAPSARSKPMRLSLDTEPWTRVFLGRRLLGQTPLMDVSLPAGTHVLRLVNEGLSIDTTVEIEGRPGERVVKRLSF